MTPRGWATLIACSTALAAGCEMQVSVGSGCARSSECVEPLVCAAGRCRAQCRDDRDCTMGTCVDYGAAGVCVPPAQPVPCAYASDCVALQACIEGTCRVSCTGDADCGGAACVSGACSSPVLTQPTGDAGPAPTTCIYNHDCPAPYTCISGACRPECLEDRDCAVGSGLVCIANVCRAPTPPCDASADGGC